MGKIVRETEDSHAKGHSPCHQSARSSVASLRDDDNTTDDSRNIGNLAVGSEYHDADAEDHSKEQARIEDTLGNDLAGKHHHQQQQLLLQDNYSESKKRSSFLGCVEGDASINLELQQQGEASKASIVALGPKTSGTSTEVIPNATKATSGNKVSSYQVPLSSEHILPMGRLYRQNHNETRVAELQPGAVYVTSTFNTNVDGSPSNTPDQSENNDECWTPEEQFILSAETVPETLQEQHAREIQRLQYMLESVVEASPVPEDNNRHDTTILSNEKEDAFHKSRKRKLRRVGCSVVLLLVLIGGGVVLVMRLFRMQRWSNSNDNQQPPQVPQPDTGSDAILEIASETPTTSSGPSIAPSAAPSLNPSRIVSDSTSKDPTCSPTESFYVNWQYCLPNPELYSCIIDPNGNNSVVDHEGNSLRPVPPLVSTVCESTLESYNLFFDVNNCNPTTTAEGADCRDFHGGPETLLFNSDGQQQQPAKAYLVVTDHSQTYTFAKGWIIDDSTELTVTSHNRGGFGLYQQVAVYNSSITTQNNLLQVVRYRTWACAEPRIGHAAQVGRISGSIGIVQAFLASSSATGSSLDPDNGNSLYEANATIVLENPSDVNVTLIGANITSNRIVGQSIDLTNSLSGTVLGPKESLVLINLPVNDPYRQGPSGEPTYVNRTSLFLVDMSIAQSYFQGGAEGQEVQCSSFIRSAFIFGEPIDWGGDSVVSECPLQVVATVSCRLTRACGPFDLGPEGPYDYWQPAR